MPYIELIGTTEAIIPSQSGKISFAIRQPTLAFFGLMFILLMLLATFDLTIGFALTNASEVIRPDPERC